MITHGQPAFAALYSIKYRLQPNIEQTLRAPDSKQLTVFLPLWAREQGYGRKTSTPWRGLKSGSQLQEVSNRTVVNEP